MYVGAQAVCSSPALTGARHLLRGGSDARPFLLCVEDPNKTDSDLGKNSYNIRNVQRALEHAFFMLAVPENNAGVGDTMLGSILKWDQRWDRYTYPIPIPGTPSLRACPVSCLMQNALSKCQEDG